MKRKPRQKRFARFSIKRLHRELQALRDRLLLWALGHAPDVAALYNVEDELPLPAALDDRARDILEPLFAIAGVIDAQAGDSATTDALTKAAEALGGARDADEAEDETIGRVVEVLVRLVAERAPAGEKVLLTSAEAVERFKDGGLSWVVEPRHAQSLLRRLGFSSGQHWVNEKNVRCYSIAPEVVQDLTERYGPAPAEQAADPTAEQEAPRAAP